MTKSGGQAQQRIPVRFKHGQSAEGVRTGNNAAWLCSCARPLPLIGYSDEIDSDKDYSRVICPDCHRVFWVVAESLKKAPTHVAEV